MTTKLQSPVFKLRTLEQLHEMHGLTRRQILDLLKAHIMTCQLQDENNRQRIIVDPIIRQVFGLDDSIGFVQLNDLHVLATNYLIER